MSDPRHTKRLHLVQNLFTLSFTNPSTELPNPEAPIDAIKANITEIDRQLTLLAPKYPLDKISRTDLAILRLAAYELLFEKKEPAKVIIDEAVTLARELGSERSFAFVNAVLGSMFKRNNVDVEATNQNTN